MFISVKRNGDCPARGSRFARPTRQHHPASGLTDIIAAALRGVSAEKRTGYTGFHGRSRTLPRQPASAAAPVADRAGEDRSAAVAGADGGFYGLRLSADRPPIRRRGPLFHRDGPPPL